MTMTTQTHNSQTCDCPMCQWADRQERQESPQTPLWADAATIRAGIADVLDSYPPAITEHLFWQFNPQDESDAETEMRGLFIDTVLRRVSELQQPPHDYPRLETLCDKHKRRRLPTYSGECVDCAKERS